MIQQKQNEETFMNRVQTSNNKSVCVEETILEIMRTNIYFTNEDINMDNSSFEKWNSYERKLIRHFLKENAHRHKVGDLLDAGLISDSPHTRRKLAYSRFSKNDLRILREAKEREARIDEIFKD